MSLKDAHVPFQHGDSFDNTFDGGSDDGSDHEDVPMIEKECRPHSRRWRDRPRMAIATLGFLLLVSLAVNVVLLWCVLQAQDLDAISVKHTSEYCE